MDDAVAAVRSLHLGHEPEQAVMLALALNVCADIKHKAIHALALKCEAAADWLTAAAVLKLAATEVEASLQLLFVRAAARVQNAAEPDLYAKQVDTLRKDLGLVQTTDHYEALADKATDSLQVVR